MTDPTTVKLPGADAAVAAFTAQVAGLGAQAGALIDRAAGAAAQIGDADPPVVDLVAAAGEADEQIEKIFDASHLLAEAGPVSADELNRTDAQVSADLHRH